jgi:hypothetical protein
MIMRELSDKELDVVCGGFISQRQRATNVAVVVSSRNILVVQTINQVENA